MRIVEETPDRLVLEERPWLLGIILTISILVFCALAFGLAGTSLWLGLGFAVATAVFALAFIAFVRRVIAIFDRPARAVVLRTASLLGQREQTIVLTDITCAEVETSRSTSSSGGKLSGVTHRTVLRTSGGPVPMTEVFSSGSGAARNAAIINRWLGTGSAGPADP